MVAWNLRENRHPTHAAKVRENVLPGTFSFLSVLEQYFLTILSSSLTPLRYGSFVVGPLPA